MNFSINLPFVFQLATFLLYWAMAVYALKHRDNPGSRPYGWLLLALGWNAILFGLEQFSPDIHQRAILRQAGWFAIATFGILHLIFVLQYTGQWAPMPAWFKKTLWAFPAILTLVNVTNSYHHLFFSSYQVEGYLTTTVFIGGAVRLAGIATNTLLLVIGLILLAKAATKAKDNERRRYFFLITGLALPLIVNTLHVLGFLTADIASLSYAPTALLVFFVITRYNLLDIAAVAQKALIENTPEGVLVITENGKVAVINNVLMKWLNLSGQVIGLPADAVLRPMPGFYDALSQSLNTPIEYAHPKGQTPVFFELTSTRLLDRRRRDIGRLVQVRDIKVQKENEEKLHNSQANLARIFDANPFALAISRLSDSRIMFFNQACSTLFGFQTNSHKDLYTKDFFANPDEHAFLVEELFQKGSIHNHQIEMVTTHPHTITVLANLIPFDYNGEDCLLIGLVDFTERLAAAQALTEQRRRIAIMEERELMARELHDTLGQVLAFVGIQTNKTLELIEKNEVSTAAVHLARLSTVVADANMDMRSYILSLKDQSSPEKGFFPALSDYLNRFNEVTGIQTILSLPEDQAGALLSPSLEVQLLRVIQEALNNIRKHSQATSAQVIFIQNNNSIQVIISDNGVGFPVEQVLAQQLTSEKNSVSPFGSVDETPVRMGLLILQDRIKSMNGTVKIHSAPGQGTQIIISLPRKGDSTLQMLRGLKFLLADDHGLILEGLTHLLEDEDIQVVGVARNGAEAVEQVNLLHPDVILMDMQMPELSGPEAVRKIRENHPDVKVIMLTISSSVSDLESALDHGADGYLLKNLPSNQFLRLIQNAVNGEFVIDPSMVSKLIGLRARQNSQEAEGTTLEEKLTQMSERQLEILKLVAEGKFYKEIGVRMKISEAGVKYHVDQILGHLEVSSRAEAVALAYQAGLATNRRTRAL